MARRIRRHPEQLTDGKTAELPLPFHFISDVHIAPQLTEREQERRRAICAYLRDVQQQGGTLFILGDFFDFWFDFGNDYPDSLRECVEQLRQLKAAGIPIHYVGGNHDYWIEGFLTQELGIIPYEDHIDFTACGKRFYLTHGDGLLKDDDGYRAMKKVLRSRLAIFLLSRLGPKTVYRLGTAISRSFEEPSADKLKITEMQAMEMKEFLEMKLSAGYDFAMMGHVHYPLMTDINSRYGLILGDWVLPGHQWFARWDGTDLIHRSCL